MRVRLIDAQQLPAGPCVVVANHASYLDGVVLKAALPARFSFVIKKEVPRVPMAGCCCGASARNSSTASIATPAAWMRAA